MKFLPGVAAEAAKAEAAEAAEAAKTEKAMEAEAAKTEEAMEAEAARKEQPRTHLHPAFHIYMGWSGVSELKKQWENYTIEFLSHSQYCEQCNFLKLGEYDYRAACDLYPNTFNRNVWKWLRLHGVHVKFPGEEAQTGKPLVPEPLRAMTCHGDYTTACKCGSLRG